MYQLARIAAFYNFEPQVTGYEDRTNGSLRSILFETRSHIVEVFNGKVMLAVSAMDGANPPHDPGRGGTKDWHQCTGQWSEDEIVNDTLRILRESNDTNVLNAISSGKRQVQAVPITVKDPAGRDVRVTPFPTVRLYDTNLTLRVIAEYRLGPTGIAGLTAWTSR